MKKKLFHLKMKKNFFIRFSWDSIDYNIVIIFRKDKKISLTKKFIFFLIFSFSFGASKIHCFRHR